MKKLSKQEQAHAEKLQAELQAQINSTTYSPREEAEKRQSVFRKNEAEKAKLKDIKSEGYLFNGEHSKGINA